MRQQIRTMNAYIDTLDDGNMAIYSYDTPIIIKINGEWVTSDEKYSTTTSRQKSEFIREYCKNRINYVNHFTFTLLCKALNLPNGYGLLIDKNVRWGK